MLTAFVVAVLVFIGAVAVAIRHTRLLQRSTMEPGRAVPAVKVAVAVQIAGVVIGGLISYTLHWTSLWWLSSMLGKYALFFGCFATLLLHWQRRLPAVMILPISFGLGCTIGMELAILQTYRML